MSRLPVFQWCEDSWVGEAIRTSPWLFPGIEAIHLLALVVIAAAVLLVDMRLFGVGLQEHSVAELALDADESLTLTRSGCTTVVLKGIVPLADEPVVGGTT
jgi:hypothetical protein